MSTTTAGGSFVNSTDSVRTRADLNYCNCVISKVNLPSELEDFKKLFVEKFSLGNQIKDPSEEDAISVFYIKDDVKTLVDDQEKYHNMLEIFSKKNEKTIFIETKILPTYFSTEKTAEFEEEIKNIVQRELNIAANNIKKCLTSNVTCSNCKKVRNMFCKKCNNQIIGYLYKKVSGDENEMDEYYCELCASGKDFPMFEIK